MRSYFCFCCLLLCLISFRTLAQPIADQQWLTEPVAAGVVENHETGNYLRATNRIGEQARVRYQAGQSVELLPGFETRGTASFEALIHPVFTDINLTIRVFPNPFIEQATVACQMTVAGTVNWTLFSVDGHLVQRERRLQVQEPGLHQWTLDGGNLPTGVYLLNLKIGSTTRILRLVKQ
ncbi:T9SS type A sorting domain-containing protein [Spirosoma pollinicola]|nr:T9SS type A sorting domain-containing protein [Spirosoma pollinicola]